MASQECGKVTLSQQANMKLNQFFNGISAGALSVLLCSCSGSKEGVSARSEESAGAVTQAAAAPAAIIASNIGSPQRLTDGDYDNGLGSVNQDGNQVVFQTNRDGKWQIYLLNLADNTQTHLVVSDANDENPVWMPDGNSVLFVSDRNGGGSEWERDIYLYDTVSGETRRMTESAGDDWYPVSSASDSYLYLSEKGDPSSPVMDRPNALYRGYMDGRAPELVIPPEADPSSPIVLDSDRVVFRNREGRLGVYTISVGTSEPLTSPDLRCGNPSYSSPNGWLAFNGSAGDGFQLYLFDLASKTSQKLETGSSEVRYPQFTPDGGAIIYSAKAGDHFQLFKIEIAR